MEWWAKELLRNYLEIVISLLELFDFQAMYIHYFDKLNIKKKNPSSVSLVIQAL